MAPMSVFLFSFLANITLVFCRTLPSGRESMPHTLTSSTGTKFSPRKSLYQNHLPISKILLLLPFEDGAKRNVLLTCPVAPVADSATSTNSSTKSLGPNNPTIILWLLHGAHVVISKVTGESYYYDQRKYSYIESTGQLEIKDFAEADDVGIYRCIAQFPVRSTNQAEISGGGAGAIYKTGAVQLEIMQTSENGGEAAAADPDENDASDKVFKVSGKKPFSVKKGNTTRAVLATAAALLLFSTVCTLYAYYSRKPRCRRTPRPNSDNANIELQNQQPDNQRKSGIEDNDNENTEECTLRQLLPRSPTIAPLFGPDNRSVFVFPEKAEQEPEKCVQKQKEKECEDREDKSGLQETSPISKQQQTLVKSFTTPTVHSRPRRFSCAGQTQSQTLPSTSRATAAFPPLTSSTVSSCFSIYEPAQETLESGQGGQSDDELENGGPFPDAIPLAFPESDEDADAEDSFEVLPTPTNEI